MILKILYENKSSQNITQSLVKVQEWFATHGIGVEFSDKNTNQAPHIFLDIRDGQFNSGGAGAGNTWGQNNEAGGRRDKKEGWYPAYWVLGQRYNGNLDYGDAVENLIHEILHCFFFQYNLQDIHYLNLRGNKTTWDYFLIRAKTFNIPDKILLHHSAIKFNPHIPNQYKQILEYHIKKEWRDIAYHFLIESDGRLKRGRWETNCGTHSFNERTKESQNCSSIAICLAGDFTDSLPTAEQQATFKNLVNELNLPVKFHRDFDDTECPGDVLINDLIPYLKNKNMIVDEKKLNQIYHEILLREPDSAAKGYIGREEEFVRAEVGKSKERQRIIAIVNGARRLRLI